MKDTNNSLNFIETEINIRFMFINEDKIILIGAKTTFLN